MVFRIEVLEFHSGPAPKGFKKDFESFLFNTRTHRQTQSKTGWKEFHLLEKSRKKIIASVAFHISGKTALSPLRAPFGSYEFSESVLPDKLSEFISYVESALKKVGVSNVEIVNHPEIYFKQHNVLAYVLIQNGYSPFRCDVSSSIHVDKRPLIEKMNKGKRKQLRHCLKMGLKFRKVPISKLDDIYGFIVHCRDERQQSLSLTKKDLFKIVKALPKDFHLFGSYYEKELVAASVCIRVNKQILYTFYSAHQKKYDAISPLTFLLSHLYDWCFKHNFKLLDMGTSNLDGKANFNLLDYKLRIGGTMSPKFSFRKDL